MNDVQTPEQVPFLLDSDAPAVNCTVVLTGIVRKVHVAQKPLGDGYFVPAVVVDLDHVGAGHHRVTAHVTYQQDQVKEAEARAARLRVGQRLAITTHLSDVRLHLPAAAFLPETS